jgi:hypothetical protein
MELSKTSVLGYTFLFDGSFSNLMQALERAFLEKEVDVGRANAPFMFLCRALREHQVVLLDVCIFDKAGKYLVSMRHCGGDRAQAVDLVYEIAPAAGLCAPITSILKKADPTLADVAAYTSSLNDPDFKEQMKGVCAAASMGSVLQTEEGAKLAARLADFWGETEDPNLRLASMSAAVSLVKKGADVRLFVELARRGADDPEPLMRMQATYLMKQVLLTF